MLDAFENLLKQAMGLDAASIGSAAIERAVQERLAACNLKSLREYWDLASASETERQELIETVVVPETWFFRDREAFTALGRIAAEKWLENRAQAPLRLLSLPSATGEEPYSMAMTLLDAGVGANYFRIDAIDISRRNLTHAARGIYGKNSFRGHGLEFRERYFEATGQGFRLAEQVRRQVQFHNDNMFASNFLLAAEPYDVVFCRNLLIYFDRATQDRAVKILERLLTANGVLFVAPSETGLLMSQGFVSANMPLAFAFYKAGPESRGRAAPHPRREIVPQRGRRASAANPTPKPVPAFSRKSLVSSAPAAPKSILDEAARLADQGRFVEAAKCCENYLRENGPSARAFYLMGLVRDATGNAAEASDYYRKALYLDPDHHETLLHLAFLMEKQGRADSAQALRDRARRSAQKQKA